MKKIPFLAMLCLAVNYGTLSAQDKDSVVTLPSVTVTSSTRVTAEIDKIFKKTFPVAQELKWYKQDKDYLAKFISEDMKHNALFTKNGRMKYDISFGYENNLPETQLNMVKSAYEGYKIIRAVNIKFAGRDVWAVNLEGMNNYVMVQLEGDEMAEVQKFIKSE